jgi:LemA protein
MEYLLIGGGILAVVLLIWGVATYNSLVTKRNQVDFSFSGIDVMLKKRHDLIPNLVAAVKQYMKHEADLLNNITALRSQAVNPQLSSNEKVAVENQLSQQLGKLQVAVEGYPELKSNQNFLQLQGALNEVEEQLSAARRAYNAAIFSYNNSVDTIPSSIIAGMTGHKSLAMFQAPEEARANVDVNQLFDS